MELRLKITTETADARADLKSFGGAVQSELGASGRVGQAALGSITDGIARLQQRLPLVGQPLAAITQELFSLGSAKKNVDELSGAFGKFQSVLAQVSSGKNANIGDLFKDFGIDSDKGIRDPTAAFKQFREEFVKFPDEVGRARIAVDVFGSDAAKLLPVLEGTATGAQAAGASIAGIATAGALAVGAFTAIAAAAVGLTFAVFAVAKSSSEAGSKIYDLSQKTGASVEMLSAFRLTAKQSNTSLEDFGAGLSRFNRLIGEAANGSKEATEKLKRFGVEPQEALKNQEAALGAVFKRINELPAGIQRSIAAQQAFGKGGDKLVDLIQSAGGNLDEFMRKAREAGEVMSKEDARAADEFGDTLDALSFQLNEIIRQTGQRFLPELTMALRDMGAAARDGRTEWQQLGDAIGNTVTDINAAVTALKVYIATRGQAAIGSTFATSQRRLENEADRARGTFFDSSPLTPGQMERSRNDLREAFKSSGFKLPASLQDKSDFFGGGGKRGGGRDKAAQLAERDIALDQREEEAQHREVTQRLAREYSLRITNLEDYVRRTKEELESHFEIEKQDFDREQELIQRTVKNAAERNLKLKELEQKRTDSLREYERNKTAIEDEELEKRRASATAFEEGRIRVAEARDRDRIAHIQRQADRELILESDAAREIGAVQLETHDRAINLLKKRLLREHEAGAEYRRIQAEIGVAEVERATLVEEVARRVEAAREREAEALVARLEQYRDLLEQLKEDAIAIRRTEIEAAAGDNRFPTTGERRSIIRDLAENERAAERERHKQAQERLERQKQEAKEKAHTYEELLQIDANYHQAVENEERRHQQALGKIQRGQEGDERQLDPFRDVKDRWEEWKVAAKDASGSIKESMGEAASGVLDGVGQMGGALRDAVAANILYGASVGQAMKQALAAQLASVSAECWIQSLKHAAWAVGSAAFGDFGSAARHAAAAAAFAGAALAAGKLGGALAQSAGLRGASTASGSAIANTANSQQRPNEQKFNYGDPSSPSSQARGEGSRGIWQLLLDEARATRRSTEQGTRLMATAVEYNTQALSTIKTARPEDILVRGADTHAGRRALGKAVVDHTDENNGFIRAILENTRTGG